MIFQAGDHMTHETIGQNMVVLGIGDINGRQLVWCEWTDVSGETKRNTFPERELLKQHKRAEMH
jgi:uncharacterized protein YodC (DUF2158 family)